MFIMSLDTKYDPSTCDFNDVNIEDDTKNKGHRDL